MITDFRNFLFLCWKHIGHTDPSMVQYDIARFMEHGGDKLMIQAFRGVGKTYIGAAFAIYTLYRNPESKILIISKSHDFAKKITHFCSQLLELPFCAHLKPRPDQRSSSISFDVNGAKPAKDPSVFCSGIEGQITGTRADLILADDIEISVNSTTADQRERLIERCREFVNIRKPGGRIIYLGTPHSEESIYSRLPEKGYDVKLWPFEVPENKAYYQGRVTDWVQSQFNKGQPGDFIEPERWCERDRSERMSEGRVSYKLQNMLDASLSDQDLRPLKINDLIVMDIDRDVAPEKLVWANDPALAYGDEIPNVGFKADRYHRPWQTVGDMIPFNGSIMSIDPSGRGKDETAYAVVKFLNGYMYVTECCGFQGGYDDNTLRQLAEIALKHQVKHVIVESNFGDGTWTALFRPVLNKIYPCAIEEVKHHTQKELRILDILEPVTSNHRLIIDPKVIQNDYKTAMQRDPRRPEHYMLMWQFSRITRDRGCIAHDDRLEALSMAVHYWREHMSVNADRRMKERKDRLFDELVKRVWGSPTSATKRYNNKHKPSDGYTMF